MLAVERVRLSQPHSVEVGGAEQDFQDDDLRILRSVAEVSERAGLSAGRIKALLHDGKIEGEFRREGRGPGKWFTSIAEVKNYKRNLPTPAEFGRKGAPAGRLGGRPRKS